MYSASFLKSKFRIIYFLTFLLFSSCDANRVYEEVSDFENSTWKEKDIMKYTFSIEDPSLTYNIYYYVRYNNDYQYYNLYIKNSLLDSSGQQISSILQGMDIFKSTTGEALGSGFGGTFDYKILSTKGFRFPYKGKFTLSAEQYMRQANLSGIQAFGYRVEKNLPQ